MMRVQPRLFRRLVTSTMILVVVRQHVLHDAEEFVEWAQLGATRDRLDDQLFADAGPQ